MKKEELLELTDIQLINDLIYYSIQYGDCNKMEDLEIIEKCKEELLDRLRWLRKK